MQKKTSAPYEEGSKGKAEIVQCQACSERQFVGGIGHLTPCVFRRREQNYTKGSAGEKHRAPVHQNLYSFCLLTFSKVSQQCTHPSRRTARCGVHQLLLPCTLLATPAFLQGPGGQDCPGRSRICPKAQWEYSAQIHVGTHEMQHSNVPLNSY